MHIDRCAQFSHWYFAEGPQFFHERQQESETLFLPDRDDHYFRVGNLSSDMSPNELRTIKRLVVRGLSTEVAPFIRQLVHDLHTTPVITRGECRGGYLLGSID